jgi:ribosomal protein S18 acetylase RimI-like enzyme
MPRIRVVRIDSVDVDNPRAGLPADMIREIFDATLHGFCLLAFDSVVPVGGLMVEQAAAQLPCSTWWLHNVYVTPARRRCGVLTRLCTHVRYLARPERVSCVRLSVHRNNAAALAAYERLGFRDITALLGDERPNSILDPVIYRRLGLNEPPLRVLQDGSVDGGREARSRPPTIRLAPALSQQRPADRSDARYR